MRRASACRWSICCTASETTSGPWLQITDLRSLSERYRMIFVCPDGEKSWYWDSPLHAESQFETFISGELPAWIDARYPTIAAREGRAITGLSMGGHGALWNAVRHPDVFGAAGSTSGGVDIRPFPDSWEMKEQLGELKDNPARWGCPYGHQCRRFAARRRSGDHLRLRLRRLLLRSERRPAREAAPHEGRP